jgi:hypothetical protein
MTTPRDLLVVLAIALALAASLAWRHPPPLPGDAALVLTGPAPTNLVLP